MKKLIHILYLFLLLISDNLFSQVTITLQQPPPFQFKVEDLWKVTLNNSGQQKSVHLTGSVKKGSADIVSAVTSVFILPNGIKRVTSGDLSPIDLRKYNNDIEQVLNKTGTFESGTYTICIKVIDSANNEIGDFCNDYEIINMTKMEIISPEENEQVLLMLPNFTWLPPTPLPPGKTVSYKFEITEILNRQTPEYSFLSNPAYFQSEKILSTLFQYPVAAKPLINGRKYAWKVTAFIDDIEFIESTVNMFIYNGSSKDAAEINKDLRTLLKKELSDNSIIPESENKFELQSSGRYGPLKLKRVMFDKEPFKFGLTARAEFEYNDKLAVNSEMPRNFGSFSVDPTVSIYGIPFNVNLFFDTRQKEFKQNINSFGFLFDPQFLKNKIMEEIDKKEKELKGKSVSQLMKIFSYFDNLGLGETYPNYTENTVNGVKITGADISFNPGLLYLAISGLNNQKAITGTTYSRKMLTGSLGIGSKDKSHFHFNMMKAWDDENSIDVNTITNGVTPKDNIVFGTDAAFKLIQDQLTIKAEANGSMLTRDKTSPDLVSEDFPKFLDSFLDPKISTQFDYLFEVSSDFKSNDLGTNAEVSFKSVGPGYVSLGAPNVRQDLQTIKFKVSHPFADKKILATVLYKMDKNNVAKLNSSTSTSTGLGLNIKINFKDYPYLIIDYRPNTVSNDAVNSIESFKNSSNVFTLTTGVNQNTKIYSNSMNLIFSSISSSSSTGLNDYSIHSFNGTDNITFLKIPLTISGSAGYTRTKSAASHSSFIFDLSAGYEFIKNWSSTFGAAYYHEEKINRKTTLYLNSSYSLGRHLNINLNVIKDFYREVIFQYGDYDNLIIRAGISSDL